MRRHSVPKRRLMAALSAMSLALACENLLGIEEAYVDPALSAPAGSSSAGTNASSGGEDARGGMPSSAGGAAGSPSTVGLAGSAGEANSAGGEGGQVVGPSLCDDYCTNVTDHCANEEDQLTQYASPQQCATLCSLLPPGEDGDRDLNTVGCRLRQARLAEYEPLSSCSPAGPAGTNACGSICDAYCGLMMQVCSEESTEGLSGHYYYDDLADCMQECSEVPDAGPFWFDLAWYTGNTIQCRLYHLIVATEDGIEHCEHAVGYSICVD